jgi:hypothetical protein
LFKIYNGLKELSDLRALILKPLCFIFFLFLSRAIIAQEFRLNGHVCDSLSNEALQGANIVVSHAQSGEFKAGTITNNRGDFGIPIDWHEDYFITVSYIGYQSFRLRSGMGNPPVGGIEIRLIPVTTYLDEVVVNWKPMFEYGDDGSVSLNLDVLGNIEKMSSAEAMEMIPGFYFDYNDKPFYNGYGNFTILINGEVNQGVLIGADSFGQSTLFTLRSIPAKYIKRVEIIPEPFGKYGFFTPVINLITKGELMDVINTRAMTGFPKIFDANINFSKKAGNIRLNPTIGYKIAKTHTQTVEELDFYKDDGFDYTRQTNCIEQFSTGKLGLDASFSGGPENQTKINIDVVPIFDSKKVLYLENFLKNTVQNSFNTEQYSSHPKNWNTSFSLKRKFALAHLSYIRLMVDFGYQYTNRDERQITSGEYQQKYKNKNTTGRVNIGYNFRINKLYNNINIKCEYQNNYFISDRLESSDNLWISLPDYFSDKRLQRSVCSFDFRSNQRLGKPGKAMQYGLSGTYFFDQINDHKTEKISSVDNLRLSGSASYSGGIYKQRVGMGYRGRVFFPTSTQLMTTPEYVNKNTIRIGNPDLKSGQEHTISFNLSHGYKPGVIGIHSISENVKPVGYAFNLDYHLLFNGIENSQVLKDDSFLVLTFANSSKKYSLNFSGNLFYHYRDMFRVQLGIMLGNEKYSDNKFDGQFGNNWSVFTKFRMKFLSKGNLEFKYTCNSPKIAYLSKIHSWHEASILYAQNFLKNNLMVQVELSNLLMKRGIRSEYYGKDFYSKSIIKKDTPFFGIRINYLLFSFYNRESLD